MEENKVERIIRSAVKQFSKYGYKKTSIDSIVEDAGVSKGFLFYHFKNKKELYCYLVTHIGDLYIEEVAKKFNRDTTDFIEMMKDSMGIKLELAKKYPYTVEFYGRILTEEVFFEEIEEYLEKARDITSYELYRHIVEKADISQFREGIDIYTALKVAAWISEGFLNEGKFKTTKDIEENFPEYEALLTKLLYKEFYDG